MHVPTPRGRLYTWMARPERAKTCVVVCSSVLGDFTANYYSERMLGRALASQGVGVIRFHYAGEGNSDGDRRDMTFSSLCGDAEAVLGDAVELGFAKFALLGTRVGALVAAAAARTVPSAPVALWEPVLDLFRFIGEAQRAQRMSQLAQGREQRVTDWRDELKENGVIDLFGHVLYQPLVESLADVELLTLLDHHPRKVMIANFRENAETARLAEALATRGFQVETARYSQRESWWLHSEDAPDTGNLVTGTAEWFSSVLGNE